MRSELFRHVYGPGNPYIHTYYVYRDLSAGETITREMLDVLRPAIPGAVKPNEIEALIGLKLKTDLPFGKEIRYSDLTGGPCAAPTEPGA